VFVPEDVQRAVERATDDDVGAWRGQRSLRSQELDELSVEGNGPVVVDLPSVLQAEDVVEVDAVSGTMDIGKPLSVSEASVVVIGEEGLKQMVGLVDGGDVLFAQIFDETILMSAIGSFDTPLGLGRMSIDTMDTKALQSLTKSR
jgi:hypothetical protein